MRINARISILALAALLSVGVVVHAKSHGLEIQAAWMSSDQVIGKDHKAYLTIANEAFHPEYLYEATTPAAERVEIHRMDGSAQMVEVSRVEIPFDDQLDMRESGYHLMLIGLKRRVLPGGEIPIKLVFGDDQVQQALIRVCAATIKGGSSFCN